MKEIDEAGPDDYVAQFCRDLRGALATIVFSTRAMSSEESNSPEVRATWLEQIHRSAEQMREIVDRLGRG